ncbi:MAG: EpsI family protein [Aquabacterium sp.]|nr:MAG: EpsI family protein [Aquabacterium sp.]
MSRKSDTIVPWIVCVVMGAASIAAWRLTPHTLLADQLAPIRLDAVFPKQFGEWKALPDVQVMIPNPQQQETIREIYTDTLTRGYVNPQGRVVYLSVAYGKNQSDTSAVHYPEVCYPAQGFSLMNSEVLELPIGGRNIRVKRLLTAQGARTEPLTYWTTVGERTVLSGKTYKLAQFGYGFQGVIPDGMIVRASSIGTDVQKEYAVQQQFLDELVRAVPADFRTRVGGKDQ